MSRMSTKMIVGTQKSQRAEATQNTKDHQHMVWPWFYVLKKIIFFVRTTFQVKIKPHAVVFQTPNTRFFGEIGNNVANKFILTNSK